MYGVIPYPVYKKLMFYRRMIYTAIIVFGLIQIFFPLTAYADIFGNHIPDVYVDITEHVKETNVILNNAFRFSTTSPYDVVNTLSEYMAPGSIAAAIRNASKTMALVVATLLLMVDFFRKSINFEWSSKWENVLIFLIKIIVIKQVVQNADTIIGTLYSMFNSINTAATGTAPEFLPYGTETTYHVEIKKSILKQLTKSWFDFWADRNAEEGSQAFDYVISKDAVQMFYSNASFPSQTNFADLDSFVDAFPNPKPNAFGFSTLQMWELKPIYFIMKAIAYVIFVVVIGRVFELSIYTIFAPLPLATFASETSSEVGKNFLKNYIATVLQIAAIVIMFVIYGALSTYVLNWFESEGAHMTKHLNILTLCALGLGVMKSGTWSKKICGIG